MSQQINLYDPSLLRKRELLTATNLAAAAAVLLLAMGGWGAAVRMQLGEVEAESQQLAGAVKGMQEQSVALGRLIAGAKPDPRLEAELVQSRERLRVRGDVLEALKKGVGADSPSFAEYLRGFARQAPTGGLWLTGLRIGGGGASMEIRGRMTDPALLPEYIARLNGEAAFRGRAFAALKIDQGKAEASAGTAPGGKADAAPAAAPFLEFALMPEAAKDSKLAAAPEAPRRPESRP